MNRSANLLLIHAFATVAMTGIIWFVQIVHYPLFARVGRDRYADYQKEHERRTGWVVAPLMLLELGTAIGLFVYPPSGVSRAMLAVNLGLLAIIWLSTFLLQVPQHQILEAGFAEQALRRLVATNWVRTVAWSMRSVLLLFWIAKNN